MKTVTGYLVDCTADGYEPTTFEDYATARDYYYRLVGQGLNATFEETILHRY